MGNIRLDDKRFCSRCNSDKTYVRPNGWHQWYTDELGGYQCSNCHNKTITNPKWHKIKNAIHNPRRIGFKIKRYAAKENPRKGVCKRCGISGLRTELHHKEYDESDPFAHTIELCMKCHFLTKEIYRNGGWFTSRSDESAKRYTSS
jgi:hypothetical protein